MELFSLVHTAIRPSTVAHQKANKQLGALGELIMHLFHVLTRSDVESRALFASKRSSRKGCVRTKCCTDVGIPHAQIYFARGMQNIPMLLTCARFL